MVRCPACHATYGLRRERVRPGLRRARCAQCPEVFSIAEPVMRLLREPHATPLEVPAEAQPHPEPKLLAEPEVHPAPELQAEPAAIAPEDLMPSPARAHSVPTAPDPVPSEEAASLSLHDLADSDEEILEKTLLIDVSAVPAEPPEDAENFASAKDAISRILGGLDAPAGRPHLRSGAEDGVDMEATLSALDRSLGAPPAPPVPAASGTARPGTATTVRISMDDIRAAIDSVPLPSTPAAPPPSAFSPPPVPPPPSFPRPPVFSTNPATEGDANLLKVQVGADVFNNVSHEQLVQWIEEGRILETHQVARQFSENWIDAVKVPALHPVFERVRRQKGEGEGVVENAQKKSLFGGLFGRN